MSVKSTDYPGFLRKAFEDYGIKGSDKWVFVIMCRRGNRSGLCWMTNETIAKESGVSKSTVSRAKRMLRRSNRIVPIARMRGTSTWRYSLHPQAQTDSSLASNRQEYLGQFDKQNPNPNKKKNLSLPVDSLGVTNRKGRSGRFESFTKSVLEDAKPL